MAKIDVIDLKGAKVKNIEIKPEEEQTYTDLYNSGILPEIATENPNMTETEIAEKAKESNIRNHGGVGFASETVMGKIKRIFPGIVKRK